MTTTGTTTDAPTRIDWTVWGLKASLVVDHPAALDSAERIMREVLDDVDRACSRFRDDSELSLLRGRLSTGAEVSPMLATLVAAALEAAELSGGDVDPTLGNELHALGYDTDFARVLGARAPTAAGDIGGAGTAAGPSRASAAPGVSVRMLRRSEPGWTRIALAHRLLTVPDDLALDLGASAKAAAADLAARRIAGGLGTAVLVSLGGDIATEGEPRTGGWDVLVQDTPHDPAQHVRLEGGWAMATSSTQKRRWMLGGRSMHHILDPRSGLPASDVWRTTTVVASTCLRANALSTAAVVRGRGAIGWLARQGAPARLVDDRGRILTTDGWPHDDGGDRRVR
ncbi:FAD:protein FMN transferase [Planctomonas sp. JC2975]|uniref:FAD:protein FMN transferase n=1 Tax=Planctomonas sp. JC2975 TaxID=2729626 RepID=UPI00147455F0|nr:FAD:protein FMN transferase [Planctomonas sp. JC2975]NNC11304.1 FAD:protein FMN transferase [Planctomonas sp. JC2975]